MTRYTRYTSRSVSSGRDLYIRRSCVYIHLGICTFSFGVIKRTTARHRARPLRQPPHPTAHPRLRATPAQASRSSVCLAWDTVFSSHRLQSVGRCTQSADRSASAAATITAPEQKMPKQQQRCLRGAWAACGLCCHTPHATRQSRPGVNLLAGVDAHVRVTSK